MSGRSSPFPIRTITEVLRTNTLPPPPKRKNSQIAAIIDAVRHIKYFSKVAELSGSKVLFEYAKYLEIMRLTVNTSLTDRDNFYVVLIGKVLCHNKEAILKEYGEGQEIGTLALDVEYVAEQECYLLYIPMVSFKRLAMMEKSAQYNQKKRFNPPKNSDRNEEVLSAMKQSHFFTSIPTFDLAELAIESRLHNYTRNESIFEEGKFPLYLYYVVSGVVNLQYTEPVSVEMISTTSPMRQKRRTRQSVNRTVNQREVFGLEEILIQQVYRFAASAASDCTLVCIPNEAFSAVVNPTLSKSVYENMLSLIASRKSFLEKSRQSNNIYKDSIRQLASGFEEVDGKIGDRLQSLSEKKAHTNGSEGAKKAELRSKIKQRNIRRYIPSGIMHTNLMQRKFLGATQDLNFGLLQSQLRKAGSRTLSPVRPPVPIRETPPYPRHVFERFIINKLEQYESFDKSKFIDSQSKDEQGSTMNFFKLRHHRTIQQRQYQQNLSSSFNKASRQPQQPMNMLD